ncbi:olfactory receptor 10A7-like [Microcaecilia unicolor]|uniref:Olfactory receptor 10A7-like n=1 Tax=Microcaecilia unicolor TaxID=1415580 RepID=A0A6P7WX25_9AMPH|nr:olfactory receptor 10A7-like [Microcaecilia unicolor]
MVPENETLITGFKLLGFSDFSLQVQRYLFIVFILFYILAVMGNLLVFTILTVDPKLHTPMYFFLRNLSFLEICFTTVTMPKTLENLLAEDRSISFLGCALQMYFFCLFGTEECVLLCIMACDRYVAICNPLRYSTVMSNKRCVYMAVGSWIMSIGLQLGQITFIFSLPFCRSKVIHHFFCDIPAVLKLSCSDTYLNHIVQQTSTVIFIFVPFLVILCSYIHIILTVLRMNSKEGRNKAFSTCASHLTAVTLFYGTVLLTYLQPAKSTADDRNFAIFYCFVIPPLNPLIYSLRSKDVKGSLRRKLWGKMQYLCRL